MPIAAKLFYQLFSGNDSRSGLPVVLIHGAGGTHLSWPAGIRRLAGYPVYALDLPGHGRSGGAVQPSIPAYTRSVLDWMDSIQLSRAVWVGHSMGSAIALCAAIEHPGRVLGLVLAGAGASLPVSARLLRAAANPETFPEAVRLVVDWSFAPQAPPRLVALAARRMAETPPAILHADFAACDAFDETQRVSQVRQPVLVLSGAADRMTPTTMGQSLAESIPSASLEIIPNAGHMLMLEQPQAVSAALLRFLSRFGGQAQRPEYGPPA